MASFTSKYKAALVLLKNQISEINRVSNDTQWLHSRGFLQLSKL